MFIRISLRTVAAFVVVQLLLGVAKPLEAAQPTRRILVSPPGGDTSATNLQERLARDQYFPDKIPDSLRPEMNRDVGMVPPPQPMPPSREQIEMIELKKNWGLLSDPSKAFGSQDAKSLLGRKVMDATEISGTPQGALERFIRQANSEESDQIEAMNEAMRKFREEGSDEWESGKYKGEGLISATDSYRPVRSSESELVRSFNSGSRLHPLSSSSLDNYSIRSLEQEQRESRTPMYRGFLDSRTTAKPVLPKVESDSLPDQDPIPVGAKADFSIRPQYAGSGQGASFKPLEPAVARILPFGNPNAFKSDAKANSGSSAPSLAPVIKPFGPLPQRNF